jgi:hypothetical protein
MSPQSFPELLSEALSIKLGISRRSDPEGMNKEAWSSPLDHDEGFPDDIPHSQSSATKSPALDFGWSNENSSFDNTALDILDYNTISDCAEENVISDVDISPIDFSPITPQASAPFETPSSPQHSYEASRLHQPLQSPRDSGLDLNFPDWSRNAFWKTVLSNSIAWNTINATNAAFLGESIHQSQEELLADRKNTTKGELEGAGHRTEPQILQTAQIMSPILGHQSGGKRIHESHLAGESANISFDVPRVSACLENSECLNSSPKQSRFVGDRARPWACELCASRFSIKGHLSQHNRYVHEKYRPHTCPSCSASFGTRFARSQHIWTVHERKKPFVCEVTGCKASFGQRSHLNRHAKRHRSENGKKE